MSDNQKNDDVTLATLKKKQKEACGTVLRELRQKNKMSQETLAYDARVDRTHISLIELGRRSPTLDTTLRLCAALNVKFSYFAARVEELLEKTP